MSKLRSVNKKYIILPAVIVLSLIVSVLVFGLIHGAPTSVSINNCGSRLVAVTTGDSTSDYKWQISDTADGTYTDITGAVGEYYDITAADEGKYIKVIAAGTVTSEPVGPIGKLVTFDLSKGQVSLGTSYSGKDSSGNTVSGTHAATNLYVVMQTNNTTMTTNNIVFSGNLLDKPFDVTLAGINMGGKPTNFNQSPGSSGSGTPSTGKISIPATSGNQKTVTLRLKDENIVRYIEYYCGGDTSVPNASIKSSLKITDINGDGRSDGGSLYMPIKVAPENIDAFVASKTNYNHWNAVIGGTDGSSLAQNMHIAGGKLQILSTLGDNCSAIGAGGNGYCSLTISGGDITAHCNGTGAAIGGGIGWQAAGGLADILITGGKIYAKNHAMIQSGSDTVGGVAIGGGSSFHAAGSHGNVTIEGGTVEAYGTFGNGLGGGNSSTSTGGIADIEITGGKVTANTIGGGNSKSGVGGKATVTVDGTADVTLTGGIGGGDSLSGNGGEANITVKAGKLECGGVIGGGTGNGSGNGGAAKINVEGGRLTAQSIGGGMGGKSGNGGSAEVKISGGTIETGSIGGGSTLNPSGALGYAKAEISGGDIVGQFIMAAGGTEPCTFTMTGGTLRDVDTSDTSKYNYVQKNGAAVYMDDPNGVATLSGGKITGCSAENGGAIYMTAGAFTISGTGSIEGCAADKDGGAVYLGGGTMNVEGGSVKDNDAERGGGVFLAKGTLTVSGGEIIGNEATLDGGGAFVDGGNVYVKGGSVTNNRAQGNGGGICINNGSYHMTAGNVDNNRAEAGTGGGIHISANGYDVSAEILAGSVSNNYSGKSGGAVAVVGQIGGAETITVQTGVNKAHTGENNSCDHDDDGEDEDDNCPAIKNNTAAVTGGALYISGGDSTKLNTYCLVEEGSSSGAGGDESRSNFMMVEGGKVIFSTAENSDGTGENTHGHIAITNSIHVTAGEMDLYGSMNNPEILAPITVDIENSDEDHYNDFRKNDADAIDEEKYYKLQYFENFSDANGNVTGQYTVYQIKHGDKHTISGNIYVHDGYEIIGWFTDKYGNGTKYEVGVEYTFNGNPPSEPGDLALYAKWNSHYYDIVYEANTAKGESHTGEMASQRINYGDTEALTKNAFVYPGNIFKGWKSSHNVDKIYTDGELVSNLSAVDGDEIIFKAQWERCTHTGEGIKYIYSADGNKLTRQCSCLGYSQTATINMDDTSPVYNGDQHGASGYTITQSSIYNNSPENVWELELLYTGGEFSGTTISSIPTNAGEYRVSITDGGKTAFIDYTIAKAPQAAPDIPTFTNSKDENTGVNTITVNEYTGHREEWQTVEYRISYYSGGTLSFKEWSAETREFTLDIALTNYMAEIRFAEKNNYLPSEPARSDQKYFFTGNIGFTLKLGEGIEGYAEEDDQEPVDPNKNGIRVIYYIKDGYYRTKDFGAHLETSITGPQASLSESECNVYDIPNDCILTLTLSGAEKTVTASSSVAENQVFGSVGKNSATISRDSAFTAYFELENYAHYSNLALDFGSQLPAGTKIIMLDKTDPANVGYWFYSFDAAANSVPIESFKKMGLTSENYTVSGDTLKLQFIVDFSHTVSVFSDNSLSVSMTAAGADSSVPILKDKITARIVNMKDAQFEANISSVEALEKDFTFKYALTDSGVGVSKWDGRSGALVLTPVGSANLPADAYVSAVCNGVSTDYLRNSEGLFIIPITDLGGNSLKIILKSNLFPEGEASYEFTAKLYASNSIIGESPLNGEEKYTLTNVIFIKGKDVEHSVKITELSGKERVYRTGDTLQVKIEYKGDPTTVTVALHTKGANGTYVNSALEPKMLAVSDGSSTAVDITLGGQAAGSYCVVATVKSADGRTVLTSNFYFVIHNNYG